ncbi:MAG: hypothetical protein ACYCQJ_12080, partial [Nitrososphaerales archaeon]
FRRVLSGKSGLIYLEMMFLSYGRIDMNFMPNLPSLPRNDSKKRVFRRVLSGKSGLIYLEMMFLSYGRIYMNFMPNLPSLPRNDSKKKTPSESPLWTRSGSNLPGDDVS